MQVDPIEGNKNDYGKLRYDLIPPDALEELVKIYSFGAGVYGDRNWELGIRYSHVFAALMRHAWAWYAGERNDKESELHHLAHAAWCCFTLLSYEIRKKEDYDDRPS